MIKLATKVFFFVVGLSLITRAIPFVLGMPVTSWWRSYWRNQEVDGKWNSWHLLGLAVDIAPYNSGMWNQLQKIPFAKVIRENDHIHFSLIPF